MELEEIVRLTEQRLPNTVFAPLGIRVERYDPDQTVIALDIDDRHKQPMGLLHGGVSALLAESAASLAAALTIDPSRTSIVGVDLNATHVKAKRSGTIRATARPVHRGRTVQVYAIDITDENGALVCVSRCTVAVRERRPEAE